MRSTERRYLAPLLRDTEALRTLSGERCRIVLLGSMASSRYVEPLLEVFGDRLFFPETFVGRGDMSRGDLLLRCVAENRERRSRGRLDTGRGRRNSRHAGADDPATPSALR